MLLGLGKEARMNHSMRRRTQGRGGFGSNTSQTSQEVLTCRHAQVDDGEKIEKANPNPKISRSAIVRIADSMMVRIWIAPM